MPTALQDDKQTTSTEPCRRCAAAPSAITIRNDALCKDCFSKYVQSKVIKRMETFRVRNASREKTRILLLPLSYGAASTALLHILSRYLKGQAERTGRTGFALHVVHVQQTEDEPSLLDSVKASYPEHSYSIIPLSNAMIDSSLQHLFPSLPSEAKQLETGSGLEPPLIHALKSCPSATSQADLLSILHIRLLAAFAQTHSCECVIWGHSTTKLAEQTLAQVAKGRGYALDILTAEGASPHGIPFYYPCRDLLSSEITAFAAMSDPPLAYLADERSNTVSTSSKQTTIDSLMQHYFVSAEKEYPSIVANVVRTAAKLQRVSLDHVERHCELCEMPLADGNAPARSRLCYACLRIFPEEASTLVA